VINISVSYEDYDKVLSADEFYSAYFAADSDSRRIVCKLLGCDYDAVERQLSVLGKPPSTTQLKIYAFEKALSKIDPNEYKLG